MSDDDRGNFFALVAGVIVMNFLGQFVFQADIKTLGERLAGWIQGL